jgi:hypothetical protein
MILDELLANKKLRTYYDDNSHNVEREAIRALACGDRRYVFRFRPNSKSQSVEEIKPITCADRETDSSEIKYF